MTLLKIVSSLPDKWYVIEIMTANPVDFFKVIENIQFGTQLKVLNLKFASIIEYN